MQEIFYRHNLSIPLSVHPAMREKYLEQYNKVTRGTGKIFLFAGDQKIEHLNKDFYSSDRSINHNQDDPRHLFSIASQAPISFFAAHLGLIAHYGQEYSSVPYLVKLNGKTDLLTISHDDPLSELLVTIDQVVRFQKQSALSIPAVGYTIYLGSRYEARMLSQASQVIQEAHQQGLMVVLWIYPRGVSVEHERSADIIAGAAGVALSLGADFVKVNPPLELDDKTSAEQLKQATRAAGKTGVLCSGGSQKEPKLFLQELHAQLHVGGSRGVAIGRNIHQKPEQEALAFCRAVAHLIFNDGSIEEAFSELKPKFL